MEGIVEWVFLQEPVHLHLFVPLPEMPDLIGHEVEFFARMGKHVGVKCPALGKLHLIIPPHFLHDGGFSMHHLIVGEGE